MTDLRTLERDSIRAFVQQAADDGYLSGRVLDYGCGKQPYRDIVEAAGGEYVGYDLKDYPGSVVDEDINEHLRVMYSEGVKVPSQTILCTQVLQYVPRYEWLLEQFRQSCYALVLTYPTNWPEVEPEDLHRFTKAGMERLLTAAGFEIVRHEARKMVLLSDRSMQDVPVALGYGVIARA